MQIEVTIKNVYGNKLVYPECEKANLFCSLCHTSTLTPHAIDIIKKLGFTINVKQKDNEKL